MEQKIITNLVLANDMRYPIGRNIEVNLDRIIKLAKLINESSDINRRVNLVCRGSSGAMIAALVNVDLLKEGFNCVTTHIKKDGEKAHSTDIFIEPDDTIVIIDDFVSTGETVRQIYNKIKDYVPRVDILALSGGVSYITLNFKPETIIAGRVEPKTITYDI